MAERQSWVSNPHAPVEAGTLWGSDETGKGGQQACPGVGSPEMLVYSL